MPKIAEAFVEITARTAKLRAAMERSQRTVGSAVKRMQASLGGIADAMTRVVSRIVSSMVSLLRFATAWALRLGAAVTAGIGVAVKFASDANETLSKLRQVFGGLSGAAQGFADALASSVGRSRADIQDALTTFQSFFVGLGFARDEAAKLSAGMSELAIDFASFNNVADSEAVERFISALSGSSEVLDRFGINIKEAALDQELLAKGFPKVAHGASEAQKALARIAIISRAMTQQGAVGDAARTLGQMANTTRRLRAEAKELAIAIGNIFIGGAQQGASRFADTLRAIRQWIDANADAIRDRLARAFDGLARAIKSAGRAMAEFVGIDLEADDLFLEVEAAAVGMIHRIKAELEVLFAFIENDINKALQVLREVRTQGIGAGEKLITSRLGPLFATKDFRELLRQSGGNLAELKREQDIEGLRRTEEKLAEAINRLNVNFKERALRQIRGRRAFEQFGVGLRSPLAEPRKGAPVEDATRRLESALTAALPKVASESADVVRGFVQSFRTALGPFVTGNQGAPTRRLQEREIEETKATNRILSSGIPVRIPGFQVFQ